MTMMMVMMMMMTTMLLMMMMMTVTIVGSVGRGSIRSHIEHRSLLSGRWTLSMSSGPTAGRAFGFSRPNLETLPSGCFGYGRIHTYFQAPGTPRGHNRPTISNSVSPTTSQKPGKEAPDLHIQTLASSRIKLWGESREPSLSAPSPKASKASAQTWQSFGSPVRALNCWGLFGDLAWALVEVAVLEPYTFNLFVLGLTVRFSSCRTSRAPERPPRL